MSIAEKLQTISTNVQKVFNAGKDSVDVGPTIKLSNHINPETGLWERPSSWPNLDSIELPSNFDGVYLTYDLTKIEDPWIGVYVNGETGKYTIERGHLSNGEFISDYSTTANINSVHRELLNSANGNIQLWRVTSAKPITRFGFATRTNVSNVSFNNYQPCVERYGQLPNATSLLSSVSAAYNSYSYSTAWLESDVVLVGTNSSVTNMTSAWYGSYNLQNLKVYNWNVSSWRPTSLTNVWRDCYQLPSLDIENWNVSSWNITALASTWKGCNALKELKLNKWNTTNWSVTSLNATWYLCVSLKKLEISNWNTTNWEVTTLETAWSNCSSLTILDLNNWNTLNWPITKINSAWNMCISLKVLNISNWKTSNWALTTLSSVWAYCYSLEKLNLNNWDTSGWSITSLSTTWFFCCSLLELGIDEWNTSSWRVTSIYEAWYNCYALTTLDLRNWNTSNWAVTNINLFVGGCNSLVSLLGTGSWTWVSSITSNTYAPDLQALTEFDGLPLKVSHSYSNSRMLSPESLVAIVTALPTITSTATLTLGTVNLNKLTNEQKAIATQKGWTLA